MGIHVDKYVLFDTHTRQLKNKVTGVLMFINRVKDLFDLLARVIVSQTPVLSDINYDLKIKAIPMTSSCIRCKTLPPEMLLGFTKDTTVRFLYYKNYSG